MLHPTIAPGNGIVVCHLLRLQTQSDELHMYSKGETNINGGQRTIVLQPRRIRNDGKVLSNLGKRVIDNCYCHFGFYDTCPALQGPSEMRLSMNRA